MQERSIASGRHFLKAFRASRRDDSRVSACPQRGTPKASLNDPLRRGYGSTRVMQGTHHVQWPLRCSTASATVYETFSNNGASKVRIIMLFSIVALTACTQSKHPVVLAPMRMETPDTSATAYPPLGIRYTRDDPFRDYERVDWPGPNRYRSSNGSPGPDYWRSARTTPSRPLSTPVLPKSPAPSRSGTRIILPTRFATSGFRSIRTSIARQQGSALFPCRFALGRRGFEGGYNFTTWALKRHVGAPQDQRHHDASRSSLASGPAWGKGYDLDPLLVLGPGARIGSDGTGQRTLRDCPVVSADAVYDDVRAGTQTHIWGRASFISNSATTSIQLRLRRICDRR